MNHPDRHPDRHVDRPADGEPDSQTGELDTQSGARLGQDQLERSNLGRHGQQREQGREPSPQAQEADPARHVPR